MRHKSSAVPVRRNWIAYRRHTKDRDGNEPVPREESDNPQDRPFLMYTNQQKFGLRGEQGRKGDPGTIVSEDQRQFINYANRTSSPCD
ncbi:hypothetical protein J6590_002195 [Homalodisca vitripennis]|nr:hypothetical protein J6590_002195 [Homalodisca vitripennis]